MNTIGGLFSPKEDVQTPGIRKSSRPTKLPTKFNDFVLGSNVRYGIEKYVSYVSLNKYNMCFASTLNKSSEPTCYNDALGDSNLVDVMNNEIEALSRNNTWFICDMLVGRKPIGCKWIFKIKYKSSGEIDRYKARLVAKGFSQRDGLDYEETFSQVVKMVTVRWYENVEKGKLCKLNTSLYGLKQDPRQWNAKLTTALAEHGFKENDIVITGNNSKEIDEFKNFLRSKFLIKDLGKLKYFLGIEVLDNDKGESSGKVAAGESHAFSLKEGRVRNGTDYSPGFARYDEEIACSKPCSKSASSEQRPPSQTTSSSSTASD
ncbi:ribonuclease H-like domain-containing protein [Tanacetum coccineum]